MEKKNKIISLTLDKDLFNKIKNGNYNCSKLINDLLSKYFLKK